MITMYLQINSKNNLLILYADTNREVCSLIIIVRVKLVRIMSIEEGKRVASLQSLNKTGIKLPFKSKTYRTKRNEKLLFSIVRLSSIIQMSVIQSDLNEHSNLLTNKQSRYQLKEFKRTSKLLHQNDTFNLNDPQSIHAPLCIFNRKLTRLPHLIVQMRVRNSDSFT